VKYFYAPGSAAAHDRAVAELSSPPAPAAAAFTVLRRAQPYDLATPGTPSGILDVARAAAEGGVWRCAAQLALAVDERSGAVVASLGLRCQADEPGRRRRAWVVYVRSQGEDGTSSWRPTGPLSTGGAALLDDADTERPMRPIGVLELKAILKGVPWVPPAPRQGPPRMRCYTCDKVTPFSTSAWRPYARHKCSTQQEGRS
jgi:hypothetical protein